MAASRKRQRSQGDAAAAGEAEDVPVPDSWTHKDSGVTLTAQNVTVSVTLGQRLDLVAIVKKAQMAEYVPKRFPAVTMRLRAPRCSAMVFSSGKMNVTGLKSLAEAKQAVRRLARIIQKLGHPNARPVDVDPTNVMATADVGFPIRLEGFVYKHAAHASYEPELFPGLIYRMPTPKVTITIFVNGKISLTGGKCMETLQEAFIQIYPLLEEFRKQSNLSRLAEQQRAKRSKEAA